MKHLTLFLLAGIFFCGCLPIWFDGDKPFIVGEIEERTGNSGSCYYYNKSYDIDVAISDVCGKFQIGDTIKLTK